MIQETRVLSLGQEDPLEKGIATHSSILAWRISWTEEPGSQQCMGSKSQTKLSDWVHVYHEDVRKRKWWKIISQCRKTQWKLKCELLSHVQLCYPMDWSLPGFSVHWILQARILEWVTISFSRGSSWPRVRTCVSCIGRQILYNEPPRTPHKME